MPGPSPLPGALPRLHFGEGALDRLPALAAAYGTAALLVTGARSFERSPYAAPLRDALAREGVSVRQIRVGGEPEAERIDRDVAGLHGQLIDVVLAIGGGSVLDAGKAIAGLLPHGSSIFDHLEGVGRGVPYRGPAIPTIAVPTTAGTGSEATRNAVVGRSGPDGFKKSFRHEALVPRHAVLDPRLLESCPPELIAADGMDALTQLLESYVSTGSTPWTRALCRTGLAGVRDGLLAWYEGRDPVAGRRRMAYAAFLSGVALARTGLGAVHGIAAPLGARHALPHGLICGTLLAAATRTNLAALASRAGDDPALGRYAEAGALLAGDAGLTGEAARGALCGLVEDLTARMRLPGLGRLGVCPDGVRAIVEQSRGSSMRTNPIALTDGEIEEILRTSL